MKRSVAMKQRKLFGATSNRSQGAVDNWPMNEPVRPMPAYSRHVHVMNRIRHL